MTLAATKDDKESIFNYVPGNLDYVGAVPDSRFRDAALAYRSAAAARRRRVFFDRRVSTEIIGRVAS